MAKKFENYRCDVCGNIVSVRRGGAGELSCCGKKMTLLEEFDVEAGAEKHKPIASKIGDGAHRIAIGSTPHPMTSEHFIEWAEATTDQNEKIIKFFAPGDAPEFKAVVSGKITEVRAYCNIHGLWLTKI
ncbi:MAG: desulfoferrodoxin FeS4 iron-binding domain-containing protein [Rickettsiales bacterium]|jgi:superoxide reductase|nr:desulfoferrodoxin FeS4 iron-binding domain-containing protein [Rickettsiales bacterium]